jgi:RNA polymerase Rpb2, domain 6
MGFCSRCFVCCVLCVYIYIYIYMTVFVFVSVCACVQMCPLLLVAYQNSPSVFKGPGGPPTYVDRVILTSSEEDHFIVKAMFRNTRTPELGDKFSSRHGQKGVVGIIVNQEDLPFTDQGTLFLCSLLTSWTRHPWKVFSLSISVWVDQLNMYIMCVCVCMFALLSSLLLLGAL